MSHIGSDFDELYELVCKAQDRLYDKDKGHELVSFLCIQSEVERESQWQSLLRQFSRNPQQEGNVKGLPELIYALDRYLEALKNALDEQTL
jgi:hypothetical protein